MPFDPRTCPICGNEFRPYRDYQRACSRNCREKLPDRREVSRAFHSRPEVRERKNASRRLATAADPAKRREQNFRSALGRYGLTAEQHAAMLTAQDGRCAICGDPPNPNGIKAGSRLHVDHCHATGRVRALLCNSCNRGIGYFHDDAERMRKAAEYVTTHQQ